MKIIGSGFGRTGTLSMKSALEQLGFGPCYHMEEVLKRPKHIKMWHDISLGKPVEWGNIFRNFQSTVDFPASVYYKELLAAYPDAKVVHTIRDPERWYDSTNETIYQASFLFPPWLQKTVKRFEQVGEMQNIIIWQKMLKGQFEDRVRAIEIFNEHTEEVKCVVPSEQLLIFNVKAGWKPLCRFLDVPVPNSPFPHVNDRQTMLNRIRAVRLGLKMIPLLFGILIAWGIYRLLSLFRQQ